MKKQDRQGARTPADLERKYALGNELKILESIEEVFKILKEFDERIKAIEKTNKLD